ncbi:MAG: HEAT repeat domain-containing protein [Chloroflexi bacterium]|nr:HEAT repeat domain-containing protein [Chloroflexota bacterium]
MPLLGGGSPNVDKLKKRRDVEALIQALQFSNDKDSFKTHKIRQEAAEALGEIKDPRAVEALLALLGDEPCNVLRAVAEALGEIGAERAVGPLTQALRCDDFLVRVDAAKALGKIGGSQAQAALMTALQDEHPYVRDAAELALKQDGAALM